MLEEVDRVEVLSLMDNYVTCSSETRTWSGERSRRGGEIFKDTLVGEHGLSLLVTVYNGTKKHTVLFDTGTALGCLTQYRTLDWT